MDKSYEKIMPNNIRFSKKSNISLINVIITLLLIILLILTIMARLVALMVSLWICQIFFGGGGRSILFKEIKNFQIILFDYYCASIDVIFNNNNKVYINKSLRINRNNIYWNNRYSLEIDKVIREKEELSNIQISYENKTDFIKRENPKVSLVITIFNQENNITLIYSCILKQEMKDIEIIFVNDASEDNSEKIIKELMEKDQRIILLKNEENKRAFYSRNKGILAAKGEYILVIDPDDLLINNILIKSYETAKKYNLDIVQFYLMIGYSQTPYLWRSLKYKSGILKTNAQIIKYF